MLTSTFLSVILLSPFLSSASANNHATHIAHRRHHNSQSRRNVSNSTDAATLAATNCTRTYNVKEGEYCYAVAAMFNITLTQFYAYNPIVDSACQNLWAGSDYCVSQAISNSTTNATSSSITPTHTAVIGAAPVLVVASAPATATVAPSSLSIEVIPSPTPAPDAAYLKSQAEASSKAEESDASVASVKYAESVASVASKSSADAAWAWSSSSSAAAASSSAASASSAAAAAAASAKSHSNTNSNSNSNSDSSSSNNDWGKSVSSLLDGITGFTAKPNQGAIMSWFRTNHGQDSTNGNSWCGFPYNDQVPGFAPSVQTMLNNFGGDYHKAATAYCGLEAKFTLPNGKTTTLVLADGFADPWVLTPNSVDVVIGAFWKLWGSETTNKNDVFQGVTWEFTGNRNQQYVFKGQGSG